MFGPNNKANPTGTAGLVDFRAKLMDALNIAGRGRHTTPYDRIATLFYADKRAALAILPYITPKLRTLEVSGEVTVPFQFVIESAAGMPIALPQPRKEIVSQVLPLLTNKDSTTKPGQTVVNPIKNDKCKAARTTGTHTAKLRSTKHKPAAKRRTNVK